MRALWLIPAVLMVFFHAPADASGATTQMRSEPVNDSHSTGSFRMGSGGRGNNWSTVGRMDPSRHRREDFHRFPVTNYVYVTPANDEQDYDAPDNPPPPNYVETRYAAPSNYWPAPVAAPAAPPAPAVNVQYATSEQPFNQPTSVAAGARVTKGTLYKYTHDGINTYTNIPPPVGTTAKKLFTYTEVDTPVASMYRCVGSQSQSVNYSSTPVPDMDCRAVKN
jgi:hypothetical protein